MAYRHRVQKRALGGRVQVPGKQVRDKANAGQPFIVETMMPPEALTLYQIEPVIAGSNYPFGAVR